MQEEEYRRRVRNDVDLCLKRELCIPLVYEWFEAGDLNCDEIKLAIYKKHWSFIEDSAGSKHDQNDFIIDICNLLYLRTRCLSKLYLDGYELRCA